jgi:hypothetical protein
MQSHSRKQRAGIIRKLRQVCNLLRPSLSIPQYIWRLRRSSDATRCAYGVLKATGLTNEMAAAGVGSKLTNH